MIDVSMMTMNWAAAISDRAVQRFDDDDMMPPVEDTRVGYRNVGAHRARRR
jgi:hypothetical protein